MLGEDQAGAAMDMKATHYIRCILILMALLVPQPAHASRVLPPGSLLCRQVDWVVVAEVVNRRSYRPAKPVELTPVVTKVSLETRIRVAGRPPPDFTTVVMGGKIDESHSVRFSGVPDLKIGEMYLLVVRVEAGEAPLNRETHLWMSQRLKQHLVERLSAYRPLRRLRAEWRRRCRGSSVEQDAADPWRHTRNVAMGIGDR